MLKSTIVVTGATGYIGSQLVLALLSKVSGEVRCRVIARNSSDCSFLKGLPVDIVRADLHDSLALMEAFKDVDTVFHCAGLISYTRNFRNALYDTNVLGTRNVVNAAIFNKVRKLVLTSSIAATPSTTEYGGILSRTTVPADMTLPLPICAPSRKVTFAPIQQSSSITMPSRVTP